jgi:hypothetical protein
MSNKVRFVRNIQIVTDSSDQEKVAIKARGVAELKMKINPVLIPKLYVTAPPDGIFELDFKLDEKDDAYTDVDMEVEVVLYIRNLPGWVKGVRINAAENSDIELL